MFGNWAGDIASVECQQWWQSRHFLVLDMALYQLEKDTLLILTVTNEWSSLYSTKPICLVKPRNYFIPSSWCPAVGGQQLGFLISHLRPPAVRTTLECPSELPLAEGHSSPMTPHQSRFPTFSLSTFRSTMTAVFSFWYCLFFINWSVVSVNAQELSHNPTKYHLWN